MVQIRQLLLTPGRGGRPGTKIIPKALVIHWTANMNKGADAVANRNYFENHSENKVSAHYVVDDTEIVQCIPEDEMAYHVGAKQYKSEALTRLSNYPNNCTIGIEICVNQEGIFNLALKNAVGLATDICRRYGWGKDRLWRHYDITGKNCPAFFLDDKIAWAYGFGSAQQGWERFKTDVELTLLGLKEDEYVEPTKVIYKEKELDGFIKDGKTYVEVRKLCESLGLKVSWNAAKNVVEVD